MASSLSSLPGGRLALKGAGNGLDRLRRDAQEIAHHRAGLVHAAFFRDDFTTASMKAMPRTPSSIFG